MKRMVLSLCMLMAVLLGNAGSPGVVELHPGDDLPVPADGKAVVVDFNATWCMPCRMFRPAFDSVAAEISDKATFVSVDIDNCPSLARRFKVRSIPYVLVLRENAGPVDRLGAMSAEEFRRFVAAALDD